MKKEILEWTIQDLQENAHLIEFGEYQREPSVWDLEKKRKLIDSILRSYDISSIYLYLKEGHRFECIDGRQRINAIFSFLGINLSNDDTKLDNHFSFQSFDELLGSSELKQLDGRRFAKFNEDEKGKFFTPDQQVNFLSYRPTIILLKGLADENDLNLMFLRLQLGVALNAGEKLNAMKGEMRDYVFGELGSHPYFERLKIPQRRFSKEQTAAQIALQYFSLIEKKAFRTARFGDLQAFFREKSSLSASDQKLMAELLESLTRLDRLVGSTKRKIELKNRAMGVSLFFVFQVVSDKESEKFFEFLEMFQQTVRQQVKLGIFIDHKYLELLKFQTYITQAAVEKYAVEGRHAMLLDYFNYYTKHEKIKEDSDD